MLESIDLKQRLSKSDYKREIEELELHLGRLHRRIRDAGIPVLVLFEAWDAAGKGELINSLILPLDPRGFTVRAVGTPNDEERRHSFLWRFGCATVAKGRIAVFDHSWYRHVLFERVDGEVDDQALQQSFQDILAFERQLTDDGAVIIKFFLHISEDEQDRRFKKLLANEKTAWRVPPLDRRRHKQYKQYAKATEDMLARTHTAHAPWTVVAAHCQRHAQHAILSTVIAAWESRLAEELTAHPDLPRQRDAAPLLGQRLVKLDELEYLTALEKPEYKKKHKRNKRRLKGLQQAVYSSKVPVVLVFEGVDAAGKGGSIKRLVKCFDPRGYEVVPVAAPTREELAHHYLWRFWTRLPKTGHITIYDRSWYGRVLVERAEGFATEHEWQRAYQEINEFEQHIVNSGTVLVKFWLQITQEEQLERFKARQVNEDKQWKITDEDWRNREKWPVYAAAIEDMLSLTSTDAAPWNIIASDDKKAARVAVHDAVIKAVSRSVRAANKARKS